MRKTTAKKMMLGIVSTCFLMAGSMMSFAGTWQQTGAGWTYLKDNNQYANNELVADNNQLYYLGADGVMKTGFVPINGVYYYFTPAGNMQTGWVLDNNNWYYMQADAAHFGQMTVNASQNVNGKSYYFGADGKMVHDTTIGQVTYGADGAAVTYQQNTNAGVNTNTGSSNPVVTNLMVNGVAVAGGQDLDLSELSKYGINLGNMDVGGDLNPQNIADYDHDTYVNEVFRLVNQERAKAGKSALTLDSNLCRIADARAMEAFNNYSHEGLAAYKPEISQIYHRYVGENITGGEINPTRAMNKWMNSSKHRSNILDDDYTAIGIGIYNNGILYYSQVFAG